MAEINSSASFQDFDAQQRPHLTGIAIEDLGLTLLATGGSSPTLDVFLVHGLHGHPEYTWTHTRKVEQRVTRKEVRVKSEFRKNNAEKATSSIIDELVSAQDGNMTYWPIRLLAHDLPTARIFTYGYDSRVTHFFNGPANQNTITDNGRALLSSIASQRQNCLGRPVLL